MRKLLRASALGSLLLSGLIGSPSVWAADKTTLAVVDFVILATDVKDSKETTEAFRQQLARESYLNIIPRDEIEKSFERVDTMLQIKLNQADCMDAPCAMRVGRDVKADNTILGNINKKGDLYLITVKLFNLNKSDIDFTATQTCKSDKELLNCAQALAKKTVSWLPKPGETEEQVKQRRITQQQAEEKEVGKIQQAEREKLTQRKTGTCPEGMILVAAREFTASSGKKVKLEEYCVDQYEYPNQKGARPLVKMEWFGAKEECAKQGKRLCTEAEWEQACSGTDANKCNVASDKGGKLLASGDSAECKSTLGIYDMCGNANEWIEDWDDPDLRTVVIKGGSFNSKAQNAGCNARQGAMPFAHKADNGFRCCK
ncbi:MAG: SUMF1/EgtB/PvdO family nonheme iron enzyme [Candidatus Schekmanbacteria bacterium]|nr:SUMF1/EgtB/PvdO family nonheme iron enzyme [Candidatus Schekmanbacteria bacterium]